MLTVVLLVVLAGGAGLLAVSMADPNGVRRLAGRVGAASLRGARGGTTSPTQLPGTSEPVPSEPVATAPEPEVVAAGPAGPTPSFAPLPTPTALGPIRRRRRGDVPAAFTAVEGSYRDVAVSPLWRRALSLVLLLALLFVAGVVLAAVAAAVLGAATELLDGAVA